MVLRSLFHLNEALYNFGLPELPAHLLSTLKSLNKTRLLEGYQGSTIIDLITQMATK